MNQDDLSPRDLYSGKGQTYIKHLILRKYLQRFARIVGSAWETITYVDCFSGPWNVKSEDLKDSSFSIALEELRQARQTLRDRNPHLKLRCFFLEKDVVAYTKLKEFADKVKDAEVMTKNAALEDSVSDIEKFVKRGGAKSFPFIFIDPTGWTGFGMNVIAPLLRLKPGEVLINFMTGDIRRFLESPQQATRESFKHLFGTEEFIDEIQGLQGHDREDAAVAKYRQQIAKTGHFNHTAAAMVLDRLFDRTRFHLIYATRSDKGIEVFKEAERKAMEEQERERAKAQQERREAKTGQRSFLSAEAFYNPNFYESLRERYLAKAKARVLETLQTSRQPVPYDGVWAIALESPLVWEGDLKEWVAQWRNKDNPTVDVLGLRPKQRVPKRGENHFLVWLGSQKA
jgi:three-Cys-motif partner protein